MMVANHNALHVPVMLERCLTLLAPAISRDNAIYLDATLGLGGHSEAVLQRFPTVRVIGVDRDTNALEHSRQRLAGFGDRVTLVHAVYDEIPQILQRLGIESVDGILFDLGVSSMQLDFAERGFSYSQDAPLDMRMNPSDELTAADILNTYSEAELARILTTYGEERFASRVAKAIVQARAAAPFTTSKRLVDLVRDAIPAATRRTGGNPAKRTFQALRIEVNAELSVLERAIPAALDAINVGGRVVVMSYHSLEDRLVKQFFTRATETDVPADLPFIPEGIAPDFTLLTRGSEKAEDSENAVNPRATSARLRAVERVRVSA
ncbi:MAG: rRNA ((1402)-N(4))-methyltransferase RsmH [Actinomycetota bacterium]|jgi:16S rRNA (cytosine1402-N4)-methyltransferase